MENEAPLGVIGGVGPAATAHLYLAVVQEYRKRNYWDYPPILIDSLPLSASLEMTFIMHRTSEAALSEMRLILAKSVSRLHAAGADCIVLPCNTLHNLVEPLVSERGLQLLHIVKETVARAVGFQFERIGLIASNSTRYLGLYEHALDADGLIVYPSHHDQNVVNRAILQLIDNPTSSSSIEAVAQVIERLSPSVDCVILGCTDLSEGLRNIQPPVPLIDSLTCLVDACVTRLCK